jgi:hypothetical protein
MRLALSFLVALACAVPAHADTITIDFDDPALAIGQEVGDFYTALGVTFLDASIIDNRLGPLAVNNPSPHQVWHSTSTSTPQPDDPIVALFATDVSSVSLTGYSIGVAGFLLRAYDAAGVLVDTQQVLASGMPGGGGINNLFTLTVTGAAIRRVEFSQVRPASDVGGSDGAMWDNLTYTTVPEPSTLVLLITPLVLGLLYVRRHQSSTR